MLTINNNYNQLHMPLIEVKETIYCMLPLIWTISMGYMSMESGERDYSSWRLIKMAVVTTGCLGLAPWVLEKIGN